MDIWKIILMAIPILLGIGFVWVKVEKILKAIDELGDIFEIIPKILADKKISDEEKAQLIAELKEAIAAFKAIIGK